MFSFLKSRKPEDTTQANNHNNEAVAPTSRMSQAIANSFKGLGQLFSGGSGEDSKADSEFFEALEEAMLLADVGLDTALFIVDKVQCHKNISKKEALNLFTLECEALLNNKRAEQILPSCKATPNHPLIILVMGVNGAGKTTTIGKLAHQYRQQGLGVTIGAGDTFRAAAEDQLEIWAKRANATFVSNPSGDAAAVMHDAITSATKRNDSVILLDTAGRLHNQTNLMAELEKINSVIHRVAPEGATRHNLLVLDATTGQNGLKQAEIFHQSIPVDGVVLTKLDGTAKGGVALSIAHEYDFPIELVGTGEAIEDLQPFVAKDYLAGLTKSLAN